jgi:hypothetical protein
MQLWFKFLAKMPNSDKEELFANQYIHFETQMEDYKRSDSKVDSVMWHQTVPPFGSPGSVFHPIFWLWNTQILHDMAKVDKEDLFAQHNINFNTHMEVIMIE